MSDEQKQAAEADPSAVAIVGMACLFPQAGNLDEYWANIKNCVDSITEIPESHWNIDDFFDSDPAAPDRTYARRGGFLSPVDFDPLEAGIAPKNLEAIDTSQLLGLLVARRALEDAGYGSTQDFDRTRAACILGVTGTLELVIPLGARLGHPIWRKALKQAGVEGPVAEDVVRRISESYVPWQENSFPGLLGNVVAGRIANKLDFGGTNCVVDAACASSLSAINLAALELTTGRADLVLAGGVDTFNDIFMYMCFSKTPALSPTGDARPFDANADGTILGEGIGLLVLRRLEDARRDGQRIYAVIRGVGSSSDGKGGAVYAPNARGQVRAIRRAYEAAGVGPETIELIEAHGTGTSVGDATEAKGLAEVFGSGDRTEPWCALGSVKSQIGHTKAAAGVAGIIKAALALHHQTLPPTIKVTKPSDAVATASTPFYLNTECRPWLGHGHHARRAGVSAFGFGGSNFHCLLEEEPSQAPEVDWTGDVQILSFSADSSDELAHDVAAFAAADRWADFRIQASESRRRFRADDAHRLHIVAERNKTDVASVLSRAATMLERHPDKQSWSIPDGAHFGSGTSPGRLAALFPGQGSQYVGMHRQLACHFRQMRHVLEEANAVVAEGNESDRRLSDHVYPPSAFSDDQRRENEIRLQDTAVAQPAIGAVSIGALEVLRHFGVRPEVVAGHSFGELTALCASRRFGPATLYLLSKLRGRLMAATGSDRGAMLAVGAPIQTVEEILRAEDFDLVIANRNAPNQVVLSGTISEIERAEVVFANRSIRRQRLAVSAAFHSPLVASSREQFRTALDDVEFRLADVPVFANSTALEYPEDPTQARELLASQLVRPVEFVTQIDNIYGSGVRTFIEVGPGNVLSGLVGSILGDRPHRAMALDASLGKRSGIVDLAHTLAQLSVLGHEVQLTEWDPDGAIRHVQKSGTTKGMTVPICGANYRQPNPERLVQDAKSNGHKTLTPMHQQSPPPSHVKSNQAATETVPRSASDPPRFEAPQRSEPRAQQSLPARPATQPQQGLTHAPAQRTSGTHPDWLSAAFQATQENLAALERMQRQTAELHRDFLHGQESALMAFQTLAEGQRLLLTGQSPAPMAPPAAIHPVQPWSTNGGSTNDTLPAAPSMPATPRDPVPYDRNLSAPPPAEPARVHREHVEEPIPQPAAAGDVEGELDGIVGILLEVVAEKTGYPTEMLNLDMKLDEDLGIDSIKRVEILSALQERLPHAPEVKPEQLGTLHSLHHLAEVLMNVAPGASAPAVAANGSPSASAEPNNTAETIVAAPRVQQNGSASAVRSQPSAAPRAMDNGLERLIVRLIDLPSHDRPRIRLNRDAPIWIVGENSSLAAATMKPLREAGYRPEIVGIRDAESRLPTRLEGLVFVPPDSGTTDEFLMAAFRTMRAAAPALRAAGKASGALLAAVSRLDGGFGLGLNSEIGDVLSGGLAGLVKTAQHEWPEVSCKVVDVGTNADVNEMAKALSDELLWKGPVEVALTPDGSAAPELSSVPLLTGGSSTPLDEGDLVIITGGARGVTAACALQLASAFRPRLVLLGRSPRPGSEPDWLRGIDDPSDIKRAILGSTEHTTPKAVEQEFLRILAAREIRETISQIERTGAHAEYHAVDVRDADAVHALISTLQNQWGPVRGLIHGAGVIADRLIEEKTDAQFEQVYSTKVNGLKNLLNAVGDDGLRLLVLFSSITGRAGRKGQADYAVANEVLNKIAQQQARLRRSCRVVSFNWGPWEGGMVNDSLKAVFANEGVGLISLEAGANALVDEITQTESRPVEVVMLGRLRDAAHVAADASPSRLDLAFERELGVEQFSFLKSHVIDGKAVLPAAMILEWLAHGAIHQNPGLVLQGVNDLRVLKAVRLSREARYPVRILSGRPTQRDGLFYVPTKLYGTDEKGDCLHASAEVVLAPQLSEPPASTLNRNLPAYPHSLEAVYRDLLFHGVDFYGIQQMTGSSKSGIAATVRTAPEPSEWIETPLRKGWIADPLVLDCCFQLMVLWATEYASAPSLPCGVGRYRQFQHTFPTEGIQLVAHVKRHTQYKTLADIEVLDGDGKLVALIEDCESVIDAALAKAFRNNQLPS